MKPRPARSGPPAHQARDRQWRLLLLVSRSFCPAQAVAGRWFQCSRAWAEASQCSTDWTTCSARRQKQASPGLSGQQARQREEQAAEERRQEAEEEARAALARHGMDKAVAGERQATKTKTNWKTIPGLRKKRAEVSAAGKLSLVQELKKMETATGSKAAAKQHLRRQYKVSHSFASRLARPSEQERLADFVHMRSLGKLDAVARPRQKNAEDTRGHSWQDRQAQAGLDPDSSVGPAAGSGRPPAVNGRRLGRLRRAAPQGSVSQTDTGRQGTSQPRRAQGASSLEAKAGQLSQQAEAES